MSQALVLHCFPTLHSACCPLMLLSHNCCVSPPTTSVKSVSQYAEDEPENNSCAPSPTVPMKPRHQDDMYETKAWTRKQPQNHSCVPSPTPPTKDQPEPEAEPDSLPRYCEDCEMWLNGGPQWEDHKIGKKHKKAVKGCKKPKSTCSQ